MQLPRLGKIFGTCLDTITAPQPLGPSTMDPGSSDDNRNTRRRLDTFSSPEDEHARSTVLLQFPCEQYHTGITNWINNLLGKSNTPVCNKPVRIHCKAGSVTARLVFETRTKCQDFVTRYKDDGIHFEIDSPFCSVKTTISVRQTKSHEDRESKFLSLMEKTNVHLVSQRSTPAHKFSASRIERNGVGNLCSNLLLLEAHSGLHLFHLT